MADNDDYNKGWEDGAYEDHNYGMLTLSLDGESLKLTAKVKKVPGAKESGTFFVKKTGKKYIINVGMGDEEYDEDDLPNPIKSLIASKGGGPNGNAVAMPEKRLVIRDYLIRPYDEYLRLFNSNRYFNLKVYDKPLPKSLYFQVGKAYLEEAGVPLYL